jgi:hypothetical protein
LDFIHPQNFPRFPAIFSPTRENESRFILIWKTAARGTHLSASYLTVPGPTHRGFSSTCQPCREQTPAAAHLLIVDRFSFDNAIQFRQLPTRASTGVDANQPSWPQSPSPQHTSTSTIPSGVKHCANALWGCHCHPSGKPSSPIVAPSPEPTSCSPLLPPRRFRLAPSSCAEPAALSSY